VNKIYIGLRLSYSNYRVTSNLWRHQKCRNLNDNWHQCIVQHFERFIVYDWL